MSRSGYSDSCSDWELICWRGAVASAIRGKRGQSFLQDLIAALDAMPEKSLIAHELENPSGEVCALGCVGKARGVSMGDLDPYDRESVATTFHIAEALASEIMYENDDAVWWKDKPETPERRWERVRAWAVSNIKP